MTDYKLTPEDHVSLMLSLVIQRAPETARHSIGLSLVNMSAAGESDEKILLMLADTLIDGLRYGNWPSDPLPN
jgi:hypothetical protein